MEIDSAMRTDGQAARRGIVDATARVALALMIVGVLYVARELLVPLALAILLSFALAPLVRVVRGLGVPRSLAVVASVLAAFAVLLTLGWLITAQVSQLIADLPLYQETVQQKISSIKGATATSDALEQVSRFLENVGRELSAASPSPAEVGPAANHPLTVQVLEPSGPLSTLVSLLQPLLHPFALTGIVVIFVVFILMQREDLRNRFIKLVGTRDLQKTTAALDDAAHRLSKLLLIQLALNTTLGIVIGLGLWVIGVPIPVLWGILAAVLRFVPYIGVVISSALPLALAAAVDPGWSMLGWTLLLFLVTEPIVGHFIEPLAFGRMTGLSPVAVVVAATFWTWLWGPIGLLLATPLTVCLVVLGSHVKGLSFLEVSLGDRPPLSAPELFYQRALAGDAVEIVTVAEEVLRERSLSEYYDQIAVPGLRLAADDVERGLLSEERAARINTTVDDVVGDLSDHADGAPPKQKTVDPEAAGAVEETQDRPEPPVLAEEEVAAGWEADQALVTIGAEGPLDAAAATMLAQLIGKHGLRCKAEGPDALTVRSVYQFGAPATRLVCIVALSIARPAHLRHAVRRLRRRFPQARIVLLTHGLNPGAVPEAHGADVAMSSLVDVVAEAVEAARRPPEPTAAPAALLASGAA